MDKKKIIEKVRKLLELFISGKIPTLAIHEVHPDLKKSERLNYIYFTLPVSINFQRSSPSMWKSALATYNDPETNLLFFPEKVVKLDEAEIMSLLTRHKLGLQRNKHTDIWIKISRTLNSFFEDDPRNIIKKGSNDVEKIIELLQKEMKKNFPYLSGPKLSNYWLYILSKYTDVKLENTHLISIIPDTHILQSTVKLGISEKILSPEKTEELWRELLKDTGINPVEVHPVLWNWSRNNFQPEV